MRSSAGKKIAANLIYAAIVIGIALGVWAITAAACDDSFVMPKVGETFTAFIDVFALDAFWSGLARTLLRAVIGYVLSVAAAAVLFYFSSVFKKAARIITPIVSAIRTLPTMAVSLVLAIWVGANAAPVILGALVIVPMLYSSLVARTATLPTELVEAARLFGAGRNRVFTSVTVPYAASALPESLSSGLSFCVKVVLAAEILMQTSDSLGMLMYLSQTYFQTAMLIAFVAVAVVVSVLLETVLRAVLRRALEKYC